MKYEELEKRFVMSNKELKEIVDTHMQDISAEKVTDMILSVIDQASEEEQRAMAEASPTLKLVYIATEIYKLGFMYALYNYNDAIKNELADIAPVQLEEHKR